MNINFLKYIKTTKYFLIMFIAAVVSVFYVSKKTDTTISDVISNFSMNKVYADVPYTGDGGGEGGDGGGDDGAW